MLRAKSGSPHSSAERRLGLVVHAEVEDRVHHARHRYRRARAHRDEQRTRPAAETSARSAPPARRRRRRSPPRGSAASAPARESGAGAGCDDEGRRDVQAESDASGRPTTPCRRSARGRRLFAVESERPRAETIVIGSAPIPGARAASGAADLRAARTTACDSFRSWRR